MRRLPAADAPVLCRHLSSIYGKNMRNILLTQAKIGMVLAADAKAADGRVIAAADSHINDTLLERLELAGVKELVIQKDSRHDADLGYDARARAARLKHLFRSHHHDSFMMALQGLLYKHFTARA